MAKKKKNIREILKLIAALALCSVLLYLIYALLIDYDAGKSGKYSHPATRGIRF